MNKLIVLRGLPASGKTSYAMTLVSQGYKRLSKDDLRSMLSGGLYNKDFEKVLKRCRDLALLEMIPDYDIVIDDTNLRYSDIEHYLDMGREFDFEVDIIEDFLDVTIEECIRRDSRRPIPVGESEIRRLYQMYLEHGS